MSLAAECCINPGSSLPLSQIIGVLLFHNKNFCYIIETINLIPYRGSIVLIKIETSCNVSWNILNERQKLNENQKDDKTDYHHDFD